MTQKTIEQWLNEWLEVYIKPCKMKNTYECYYYQVHLILKLCPAYKTKLLGELTELDIQKLINSQASIYSKSTLIKIRLIFHEAYEAAIHNNFCKINPACHIFIPIQASVKEVRALTRAEQNLVEQSATSDPLGHIVQFFLYTGLRSSELCNLKWSDYDSTRNEIHIRKSKTKAGIRTIPLLKKAKSIISSMPKLNEYVFNSTQFSPVTKTVLKRLYMRMRKATNLDFITTHVFRHTFATRLVENGIDYKALSALLGHTNVAFTLQRYTNAENDFLREQISLLEKNKKS